MADYIHHCMWYTVWDAKTGELVAAGTSAMCARKLGYATDNSFAAVVSNSFAGRCISHKYTFERERIERREVDSLPPVRRRPKQKARRCWSTDELRG